MSDLNQCQFIGRLGSDPEISQSKNGKSVARFSIAVSEKWTDDYGNRVERTEWVNISAFGGLADVIAKYLTKGSQVFISGKMQTREYTDKNGIERKAVSIIADNMQMLGSRPQNSGQTQNYQQQPAHNQAPQRTQQAAPGSHVQPYNPPVQYGNHSAPPIQAQYTQRVRDDDMPF